MYTTQFSTNDLRTRLYLVKELFHIIFMGFRIFCKVYNMYILELFVGCISSVFKKTYEMLPFSWYQNQRLI